MICSCLESTFCIAQFIFLLSELVYNMDVQEEANVLHWLANAPLMQ